MLADRRRLRLIPRCGATSSGRRSSARPPSVGRPGSRSRARHVLRHVSLHLERGPNVVKRCCRAERDPVRRTAPLRVAVRVPLDPSGFAQHGSEEVALERRSRRGGLRRERRVSVGSFIARLGFRHDVESGEHRDGSERHHQVGPQRGAERGRHGPSVPEGEGPARGELARAYSAATALAALASRLLRRAAVRLCTMPLLVALSSARLTSRERSRAASASPSTIAACTRFCEVLSAERTALLRSRRTSFCLFRLICDLMFAIRRPAYQRVRAARRPRAAPLPARTMDGQ